jgi:hypothetical protein
VFEPIAVSIWQAPLLLPYKAIRTIDRFF